MPDRCFLLLTSKVALSRSKSMNFVYQKHSTAVQLVYLFEASWIQVLYTATQLLEEYNYSTHRPGISNLRLWRIILKGRNFFFYVPFFTILIFGKVSVMGYFEIVSVKKVHKLVYIDLIAFKCIIPCKIIGRCKNNTCNWLYSQQPYS